MLCHTRCAGRHNSSIQYLETSNLSPYRLVIVVPPFFHFFKQFKVALTLGIKRGLLTPSVLRTAFIVTSTTRRLTTATSIALPSLTHHSRSMSTSTETDSKTSTPTGRGAFVLLEGLDRCGKTSQVKRLVETLNKLPGTKAEAANFPDRSTDIGGLINAYLQGTPKGNLSDEVIHLLYSANRWEAAAKLKQKLESGVTLVVDRYSFSGVAFSAAKGNKHMSMEWCFGPEVGLPAPDVIFYLDVSQDVAEKRGGYGLERYERKEFQSAVGKVFHSMREKQAGGCDWVLVDANAGMDDVAAVIEEKAKKVIEDVKTKPVGVLKAL